MDKHGITLVHITFPPSIKVLTFAILSEIFTHVVGKNVFIQFIAVKIPWQSLYKNKKQKQKNSKEKAGKRKSGHLLER